MVLENAGLFRRQAGEQICLGDPLRIIRAAVRIRYGTYFSGKYA
jgi:hypothetical protein